MKYLMHNNYIEFLYKLCNQFINNLIILTEKDKCKKCNGQKVVPNRKVLEVCLNRVIIIKSSGCYFI